MQRKKTFVVYVCLLFMQLFAHALPRQTIVWVKTQFRQIRCKFVHASNGHVICYAKKMFNLKLQHVCTLNGWTFTIVVEAKKNIYNADNRISNGDDSDSAKRHTSSIYDMYKNHESTQQEEQHSLRPKTKKRRTSKRVCIDKMDKKSRVWLVVAPFRVSFHPIWMTLFTSIYGLINSIALTSPTIIPLATFHLYHSLLINKI